MPRECPICGEVGMEEHHGEFRFDFPPNIPGGEFLIPDVTWEECSTCGEAILSPEIEDAIDREHYRRKGLLTPDDIKAIRERTGLSQKEMAERLGVGEKTYTRWENGYSMHNKSNDNMIRLFDRSPEVFEEIEAPRDPERRRAVAEYIASLATLKGENEMAMAAHGAHLDPRTVARIRKALQEMQNANKGQ